MALREEEEEETCTCASSSSSCLEKVGGWVGRWVVV